MTDGRLADGGKDGAVHGCYNYIHGVTPDVINQIAMNLITASPHRKDGATDGAQYNARHAGFSNDSRMRGR